MPGQGSLLGRDINEVSCSNQDVTETYDVHYDFSCENMCKTVQHKPEKYCTVNAVMSCSNVRVIRCILGVANFKALQSEN
jgi:hypothetical protein